MKQQKWMPIVIIAVVAVIVFGVIVSQGAMSVKASAGETGPTANNVQEPKETPATTPVQGSKEVASEQPTMIPNPYVEISQPVVDEDAYVHEREFIGQEISEKFYLIISGEKKLLYSIDFGAEEKGNWLGKLVVDAEELPVSYTIYAISDEEMAAMSEEEIQRYADLMDGLGNVLSGIAADSRFSAEQTLPESNAKTAHLIYWELSLPETMTWTETNDNGEYQAIFYGTVQGEQIPLYTVRIGDVEAQSVLGKYRVDGVEKTLSIESYALPQREQWTDEDRLAAYEMMDTINDVIQAIDASTDFVAE